MVRGLKEDEVRNEEAECPYYVQGGDRQKMAFAQKLFLLDSKARSVPPMDSLLHLQPRIEPHNVDPLKEFSMSGFWPEFKASMRLIVEYAGVFLRVEFQSYEQQALTKTFGNPSHKFVAQTRKKHALLGNATGAALVFEKGPLQVVVESNLESPLLWVARKRGSKVIVCRSGTYRIFVNQSASTARIRCDDSPSPCSNLQFIVCKYRASLSAANALEAEDRIVTVEALLDGLCTEIQSLKLPNESVSAVFKDMGWPSRQDIVSWSSTQILGRVEACLRPFLPRLHMCENIASEAVLNRNLVVECFERNQQRYFTGYLSQHEENIRHQYSDNPAQFAMQCVQGYLSSSSEVTKQLFSSLAICVGFYENFFLELTYISFSEDYFEWNLTEYDWASPRHVSDFMAAAEVLLFIHYLSQKGIQVKLEVARRASSTQIGRLVPRSYLLSTCFAESILRINRECASIYERLHQCI